jgi:ubiquitin-conjugating enzyme E2 I
MEATALKRLKKERIDWRAEHPPGFYARLKKNKDGTHDYFNWECGIPGPKGTPWEGGLYKINLKFPEDYPVLPPKCVFEKKLFHPNVYPSGAVCLSIINDEEDWRAGLKVKDILLGIQDLLANPNTKSPAQKEAFESYNKKSDEYRRKVREQAKECVPKLEDFKRHLNKNNENEKDKDKEKDINKNSTNSTNNNNDTNNNTGNNNSSEIAKNNSNNNDNNNGKK